MIIILDKVIYGLGALTFVGVSLFVIFIAIIMLTGIGMSIFDPLKKFGNKGNKAFGGKDERINRD